MEVTLKIETLQQSLTEIKETLLNAERKYEKHAEDIAHMVQSAATINETV